MAQMIEANHLHTIRESVDDMGHEGVHFIYRRCEEERGAVVVASELADDEERLAQELLAVCRPITVSAARREDGSM